jgi:hypothetical protein
MGYNETIEASLPIAEYGLGWNCRAPAPADEAPQAIHNPAEDISRRISMFAKWGMLRDE